MCDTTQELVVPHNDDKINYQHSGQVFKAAITDDQAHILRRWIGIARYLWNLMLSQRENRLRVATLLEIHYALEKIKPKLENCSNKEEREIVREKIWEQFPLVEKRTVSLKTQSAELTELRNTVDWIGELPRAPSAIIVRDLDKTFQKWFAYLEKKNKGVKTIEVGYPQYKTKFDDNTVSFCRNNKQGGISFQKLNNEWGAVLISRELPNYMDNIQFTNGMRGNQKIGWVKFRLDKPWLDETLARLTITDTPNGWTISVGWKWEADEIPNPRKELKVVAIDLGAKIPVAWWDGTKGGLIPEPKNLKKIEAKIKKAKQQMSRCKFGSGNYKRAQKDHQKFNDEKTRITRAFRQEVIAKFDKEYDVIVFENLNIPNMTKTAKGTVEKPGKNVAQKTGLNRVMLRLGLGALRALGKQKFESQDKTYIEVGAAWTSIGCSKCEHRDPENRTTQSLFECTKCGHRENADINAAKNIRKKGMVELEKMGLI